MNKKLKKQKRKLILRISAVMLAAFLTVSVILVFFTLDMTEKEMLSDVQTKFETLAAEISDPDVSSSYENLRSVTESAACEYVYLPEYTLIGSEKDFTLSNYVFNPTSQVMWVRRTGNIHIILKDITSTYSFAGPPVMDTDDYYGECFTAVENKEDKVYCNGELSYKRFRESMTDEQYEAIAGYLKDSPTDTEQFLRRYYRNANKKSEKYYQLVCTEFYIGECQLLLPKTVEIVLTDNTHDWYVQDEVIRHFDLSLKESDISGGELMTVSQDSKAVIPATFFFHTFSSGNLKRQYEQRMKNDYDTPALAPYHTICNIRKICYVDSAGYSSVEWENTDESRSDKDYKKRELSLEFYYDINVIPNALQRIGLLTGGAFLFFLTIGIILCITLWRVMKTQFSEEEKRRQMVRSLAHDIKTPLFIIEGYAQNLMENLNTEKREHYAGRIIERTSEVNGIVHRMLDYTKLDGGDFIRNDETFDLCGLFDEVSSRFRDTPNWNKTVIEKEETLITADRELFQSVITNLIDNAFRYATPYSEIHIRLMDRAFSVSNSCFGLTKQDIPHLTEPYFRKDESRSSCGNGLGLAVTKSILDLYGIRLTILLEDNVITFRFRLP
ncbi:MAG: HAMP domain-containing histidine kinase [Ruminococcus sp.]|nr:HAMP domain-containing histidine kinase [Ruminococcus sp.]